MLIEIAIGDSFGAPFEFQDEKFVQENYNKYGFAYINRKGEKATGAYTDDTQMSLAVALVLTENRSEYSFPTQRNFGLKFLGQYLVDPREGYSRRTKCWLQSETVSELLEAVSKVTPRNGNGSVMRTLPIGLLPDPEMVKHYALVQATVTHQTTECIVATQIMALAAHYYYYILCDKDQTNLWWWLNAHIGVSDVNVVRDAYRSGRVENDAITTTSWVLNVLQRNDKYTDVLYHALQAGGDVDSICALGLGLMSLNGKFTNDLPKELYSNLEDGTYGRRYIEQLDKELLNKFKKN